MKDENNLSSALDKGGYNKPLIITSIVLVIIAIIGLVLVIMYKNRGELCKKRIQYLEENGYVLEKDREVFYECRGSKYCYKKGNKLVLLNVMDDDIRIVSYFNDKYDGSEDLELIGGLIDNKKIANIAKDYSDVINNYTSIEEIDLLIRFDKHSLSVGGDTVYHYFSEGIDEYNNKLKYTIYYNGGENDGLVIGGMNVTYVDGQDEEELIKKSTNIAFDYNDTGLEFFKDYISYKTKEFKGSALSHDINVSSDHYTNYCTYENVSYNKEKIELYCRTIKRIGSINNDYSNYLSTVYKEEELSELDKHIDNDIVYLKEKLVLEPVDVDSIKNGIKDYIEKKEFDEYLTLKYDKFDVVFMKKYDDRYELKYNIKVEDNNEQVED